MSPPRCGLTLRQVGDQARRKVVRANARHLKPLHWEAGSRTLEVPGPQDSSTDLQREDRCTDAAAREQEVPCSIPRFRKQGVGGGQRPGARPWHSSDGEEANRGTAGALLSSFLPGPMEMRGEKCGGQRSPRTCSVQPPPLHVSWGRESARSYPGHSWVEVELKLELKSPALCVVTFLHEVCSCYLPSELPLKGSRLSVDFWASCSGVGQNDAQ